MKQKIISEKTIFKGQFAKIVAAKIQLTSSKIVDWEYIDSDDTVTVLPLDEDNNVYLCKEWRLAWKREVIQIPAGVCPTDKEEVRVQQVHNELREEIGMDAGKIEKLLAYYAAGRINYQPHVYLGTKLFPSKKEADEDEILKVIKMPFEKAYEMFISGKEPTTSYTLIAFLMVKEKLGL